MAILKATVPAKKTVTNNMVFEYAADGVTIKKTKKGADALAYHDLRTAFGGRFGERAGAIRDREIALYAEVKALEKEVVAFARTVYDIGPELSPHMPKSRYGERRYHFAFGQAENAPAPKGSAKGPKVII